MKYTKHIPIETVLLIGAILIMLFNNHLISKADEFLAFGQTLTREIRVNAASWQLGLDLDRLAYAVAIAETGGCKKGSAISHNNCFGIITWKYGKRRFKYYSNKEESYKDFKRIWSKYYKVYPTIKEAVKWTGNDRASIWLNNVSKYYVK
jgi:hypothetical protein